MLGSQILNFTPAELMQAGGLPDVLDRLGLHQSRASLLYALGHEFLLRKEGSIPPEETSEKVAELFTLLASQPSSDDLRNPVIFNGLEPQIYVSTVLGIRVEVRHQGSKASILIAEAVIGSIEALFATTIDLNARPHTEAFTVTIEESTDATEPHFTFNHEGVTATVHWPADRLPATYGQQGEVQKMLVSLAGSVFAATCLVRDVEATLTRFFNDDAVLDRIAMVAVVGNSHQRFLNSSVSRLGDWAKFAETVFALEPSRPNIVRRKLGPLENGKEEERAQAGNPREYASSKNHRDFSIRSIIDIHLWNRAGWSGTAFADWGPSHPPVMALLFTDAAAARKIFERWRERFGLVDKQDDIYIAVVRGISADKPAHYRVLVTARLRPEVELIGGQQFVIASRINTMHAESDVNLVRFLDTYGNAGTYSLIPAIWKGKGEPELLLDLAILKRELSVKTASEVGEQDIEVMALGPRRQSEE